MREYTSKEALIQDSQRHGYHFSEPIHIRHKTDILWSAWDKSWSEEKEVDWAAYKLAEMPGCCGLAISYNAEIHPDVQGFGLGEHFHKERLELISRFGYSCAICTVTEQNTKQIELLLKNNWRRVHSFINRRTRNVVQIWVKDIS